MKGISICLAALLLTSCATTSQNIQPIYVSPMTYDGYDCTQLSLEADRISQRVSELTGQIDQRASGDKTQAAVAFVLFWPAVFFLGDNEAQNAELSKLKGEFDAIEQVSITKKCLISTPNNAAAADEAPSVQDRYSKLERLAKLKDDGVLTEEEFLREKNKLLSVGD